MTAVRLPTWGKRKSKYGNRRVRTAAGVSFDSVSEQRRWEELKLLEKAGEIRNLTLHPRYSLDVNGVHIAFYIADFAYESRRSKGDPGPKWVPVVEDFKAGTVTQTDVFKLKRKLMLALHGVEILITGEAT